VCILYVCVGECVCVCVYICVYIVCVYIGMCVCVCAGVTVENTKDHSKFAIVIGTSTVCIGGVNRMQSQEAR